MPPSGGLCSYTALIILRREAEHIVSQSGELTVETLFATLTRGTPMFLSPIPCSTRVQHQNSG
jgi:hypothetical protein